VRLVPEPAGRIVGGRVVFAGEDLLRKTAAEMRWVRGKQIAMVLQDPMTSLNPALTIGTQVAEVVRLHQGLRGPSLRNRILEALRRLRIPAAEARLGHYPHQLSGGMRQRAMIAMALVFSPELVIMDEPTSALDVVAQRSLMLQIKELQRRIGFAAVFVTHDMSLVSHFSDRLAVMYAGQIVEVGATRSVFEDPKHPYTKGLMQSFPSISGPKERLVGIAGSPPDLLQPPAGCRFHPRCPSVMPRCRTEEPPFYEEPADLVRCHLYDR